MANREKGEVSLVVGETSYTLVLNTNAMAAIEEHLSTPEREVTWDVFWARVMKGSVRAVIVLLWGMSRKFHPELTPEQVADILDESGGLLGLTRVLTAAAESLTPSPEDSKALAVNGKSPRPRKAQAGGTGANSNSRHAALA